MKRILFVDDEPKVLAGLERMLFEFSDEWDMTFVESGQAALDAMAIEPFDVLVTDMRMPGIDGTELLTRVHEQYPSTVRIILSGHTERDAAMRAVPVAHRFLSKPCDSAVIRDAVTRVCDLQGLLNDEALQKEAGSIESLPAVPRVYEELVAVLAEPEVDLDAVAAVVEQDAGISAKLLQLVNSSFFGLATEVGSIRQATSYLGVGMISNLTLSMGVFGAFEKHRFPASFSLEAEQAHATLSGKIAKKLLSDKDAGDHAFLGAMLHDTGKLILAVRQPDVFDAITSARKGAIPFHAAEASLGRVSHGVLGAYLLGIWGMPFAIVEAVAHHDRPSRVPHKTFDVLGAVHVGNCLAHELEGTPFELDMEYIESMGLADELPGWREIAAEEHYQKAG